MAGLILVSTPSGPGIRELVHRLLGPRSARSSPSA
jgi:hypothetical protein